MKSITTRIKKLDVQPMVTCHMDQPGLSVLFEKYIPNSPQMALAPAQALSTVVFNIINAPDPLYKIEEWAADYLDGIGENPDNANKITRNIKGAIDVETVPHKSTYLKKTSPGRPGPDSTYEHNFRG